VPMSLSAGGFARGLLGILVWRRSSGEDVGGVGGIPLRFRFGVEVDCCDEGGGDEEEAHTSGEADVVILMRDTSTCKCLRG
jgi:hypothetical protein